MSQGYDRTNSPLIVDPEPDLVSLPPDLTAGAGNAAAQDGLPAPDASGPPGPWAGIYSAVQAWPEDSILDRVEKVGMLGVAGVGRGVDVVDNAVIHPLDTAESLASHSTAGKAYQAYGDSGGGLGGAAAAGGTVVADNVEGPVTMAAGAVSGLYDAATLPQQTFDLGYQVATGDATPGEKAQAALGAAVGIGDGSTPTLEQEVQGTVKSAGAAAGLGIGVVGGGAAIETGSGLSGGLVDDGVVTAVDQDATGSVLDVESTQSVEPPKADLGLDDLGETPEPGTRSETREEYEARDRRERATATVRAADQPLENPRPNAATEGHGHARHGFETTDEQQAERVRTGRYPDEPLNQPSAHDPAGRASRFTSPEAEAEALGRGRRALGGELDAGGADTYVDPATGESSYVNPADGVPSRVEVNVPTNRAEGYGDSMVVQRQAPPSNALLRDAAGDRVAVPSTTPLPTAKLIYEYVPSVDDWHPVSYYPQPEPLPNGSMPLR